MNDFVNVAWVFFCGLLLCYFEQRMHTLSCFLCVWLLSFFAGVTGVLLWDLLSVGFVRHLLASTGNVHAND